jgi:hypothetical protein
VTKDGKVVFTMRRPKRRKPSEQKPIVKRKPLPVLTPAPRRELPYLQQFLAKLDKHSSKSSVALEQEMTTNAAENQRHAAARQG